MPDFGLYFYDVMQYLFEFLHIEGAGPMLTNFGHFCFADRLLASVVSWTPPNNGCSWPRLRSATVSSAMHSSNSAQGDHMPQRFGPCLPTFGRGPTLHHLREAIRSMWGWRATLCLSDAIGTIQMVVRRPEKTHAAPCAGGGRHCLSEVVGTTEIAAIATSPSAAPRSISGRAQIRMPAA